MKLLRGPFIRLVMIVLILSATVGCSRSGDQFVGKWESEGRRITLDISRDGKAYLVKMDHPGNRDNMFYGTFQGRINNGQMVLNHQFIGPIAYSESQDALLLSDEVLKRVK